MGKTAVQGPSVSEISLANIACEATKTIVKAWNEWRGSSAMPSILFWVESEPVSHQENVSIARVVDDGRDYEFEFIGEAHLQAYSAGAQNLRVSAITHLSPRFGKQLKASFDLVRISGQPHAFQGSMAATDCSARKIWFESVYLPLCTWGNVDHILNVAVYRSSDTISL